ncbi:MAG: PatB family C-S lyase [Bacteroidaceae bacterium]|nr:PatB family C-S lyase [Bacteroidaceae bacterium]
MKYNFDEVIDRRGTGTYKYGELKNIFGREDLLPLWVADMDFATPPFIVEALKKRLEHPVFGYTMPDPEYWQVVSKWIEDHHGWKTKAEWMTFIPGIVKGIGFVVNVFLKEDEKVIIQPPVYHPFRLTPQGNKREVLFNPLQEQADGSYKMNFEQLEQLIAAEPKAKLMIISNPHNPAGILWDKETLQILAHICAKNNILVISDEIHCDMALWGKKHIPFASVSEEAAQCSITFGAPSKTFNIAGIVSSYAVVPNDQIREKFFNWIEANELSMSTFFADIATMTAFKEGEEWRQQMLKYVEGNVEFVENYLKENMPQIKALRPEASFLVWLDCRGLGLNHDELFDLFVNKARVAFNDGAMFGEGGSGFMRMNVGAPRSIIKQALDQIKQALS